MPSPSDIKREVSRIEGSKGKEKDFYRAKRKSAFTKRHGVPDRGSNKPLMINGLARTG